jgi:hypothetical protein
MMLDFAYGRRAAHATALHADSDTAPTTSTDSAAASLLALAAASKAWWESTRPNGWTLEQHLADPSAGCGNAPEERSLARAVAHWIRQDC